MDSTGTDKYNWNRVFISFMETLADDPADKALGFEHLHDAQRQLIAEIKAHAVSDGMCHACTERKAR